MINHSFIFTCIKLVRKENHSSNEIFALKVSMISVNYSIERKHFKCAMPTS